MTKRQYDTIITNMGGSKFTGYYKEGINLKLTDGVTVVTIWKPERCPYYDGKVYKDAIIQLSGNATNNFTYKEFLQLQTAIESAIDYLNNEKENQIDREQEGTYDKVEAPKIEKKKTKAIRYDDLEIGGIYSDEKKKNWVFLGKGTLLKAGEQENRSNDGVRYSEYLYMPYNEDLAEVGPNTYQTQSEAPDTYATKKRFFEKIDSLNVTAEMPITIIKTYGEFHTTYQACDGVKPKTVEEQWMESRGHRR